MDLKENCRAWQRRLPRVSRGRGLWERGWGAARLRKVARGLLVLGLLLVEEARQGDDLGVDPLAVAVVVHACRVFSLSLSFSFSFNLPPSLSLSFTRTHTHARTLFLSRSRSCRLARVGCSCCVRLDGVRDREEGGGRVSDGPVDGSVSVSGNEEESRSALHCAASSARDEGPPRWSPSGFLVPRRLLVADVPECGGVGEVGARGKRQEDFPEPTALSIPLSSSPPPGRLGNIHARDWPSRDAPPLRALNAAAQGAPPVPSLAPRCCSAA